MVPYGSKGFIHRHRVLGLWNKLPQAWPQSGGFPHRPGDEDEPLPRPESALIAECAARP